MLVVMRPSAPPCQRVGEVDRLLQALGSLRTEERGAEVGAHAAVDDGLGRLVHEEVVVGERGDAALDHLGRGQQRAQVHVALADVHLHRPDVVVEPTGRPTRPRRRLGRSVIAAWQCVLMRPGMATMPSGVDDVGGHRVAVGVGVDGREPAVGDGDRGVGCEVGATGRGAHQRRAVHDRQVGTGRDGSIGGCHRPQPSEYALIVTVVAFTCVAVTCRRSAVAACSMHHSGSCIARSSAVSREQANDDGCGRAPRVHCRRRRRRPARPAAAHIACTPPTTLPSKLCSSR